MSRINRVMIFNNISHASREAPNRPCEHYLPLNDSLAYTDGHDIACSIRWKRSFCCDAIELIGRTSWSFFRESYVVVDGMCSWNKRRT